MKTLKEKFGELSAKIKASGQPARVWFPQYTPLRYSQKHRISVQKNLLLISRLLLCPKHIHIQPMLHEVAEFENVVISTGGGAPCFFDNMDFMNRTGKTVFLDVHPDVLFRRLRVAKQQRPILQGKEDDELKAFIVQALEKRAPFYHQAQYIFNADELEDRWQIETSVQRLQQLLGL